MTLRQALNRDARFCVPLIRTSPTQVDDEFVP